MKYDIAYYTMSKKVHPFYFYYSVKCWPILTIFGSIAAKKICKQTIDFFLSYNIQFMYEYYAIEKQKIFCMLSMLPLRLAVVPVSCSFFESLFSPRSLQPLFRNSLISFFASQLLKCTNFLPKFDLRLWSPCLHQNIYTKPSATKQRAFGIWISK